MGRSAGPCRCFEPRRRAGGIGTAAILGILSVFAESGGELVSGLRGMSDVLIECADRYADQDIATADSINNSVWVE